MSDKSRTDWIINGTSLYNQAPQLCGAMELLWNIIHGRLQQIFYLFPTNVQATFNCERDQVE